MKYISIASIYLYGESKITYIHNCLKIVIEFWAFNQMYLQLAVEYFQAISRTDALTKLNEKAEFFRQTV